MRRALTFGFALALTPLAMIRADQPMPAADFAALLARVGAAVERYYARAQSLICVETVRIQSLGFDLIPDQSPTRQLTYELRVAWADAANRESTPVVVQRELLKINNRAPRPKDKPECLDPSAVSPDTLAMLLPSSQADYAFNSAGTAKFKGRDAFLIDYKPKQRDPVSASAFDDREACFQINNVDGYIKGRVWIDAQTDSVLRLDQHLNGFVDVTVPADRKRFRMPLPVVLERADSSIVFGPIAFADPEEVLMLPVSADTLTVIRNSGTPRVRESRRFADYRRFLTGGRIVDQQ